MRTPAGGAASDSTGRASVAGIGGPADANTRDISTGVRAMDRPLCRLFGCRWEPDRLVPEDDPRWDRTLWRCSRCGDRRKVWIGYRGLGKPDRFYAHTDGLDGAETMEP